MGAKISKVDNKVIEQRFNELKSMASDGFITLTKFPQSQLN